MADMTERDLISSASCERSSFTLAYAPGTRANPGPNAITQLNTGTSTEPGCVADTMLAIRTITQTPASSRTNLPTTLRSRSAGSSKARVLSRRSRGTVPSDYAAAAPRSVDPSIPRSAQAVGAVADQVCLQPGLPRLVRPNCMLDCVGPPPDVALTLSFAAPV